MASSPNDPTPRPVGVSLRVVALALVPVLALTLGIPFANRLEPRIFGLPFLLAWIVGWILLTPVFMAVVTDWTGAVVESWLARHPFCT